VILGHVLLDGRGDLVVVAPHRESGYRLLMRALATEDNVAEALDVYEQQRQRLRDDLGVPRAVQPRISTAPCSGNVPVMCRNIKTLHNFEPPVTSEEIHAAALQYVRKVSGQA